MSTPLGSMPIELGLDRSQFASHLNASKKAVHYFSKEAQALDGDWAVSRKEKETLGG